MDGIKYHDLNGNGSREQGEPGLEGWTFTLTGGPDYALVDSSTVSGPDGSFSFTGLAAGDYTLTETTQTAWHSTTPNPVTLLARSRTRTSRSLFGNVEDTAIKTFELTYENAPEGSILYVDFLHDGEYRRLTLVGDGPLYSAQIELPVGTVLTDVTWRAFLGGEFFVLGDGVEEEVLEADLLNEFDYDPSVGGFKFEDLNANGEWDEGEPPVEGWQFIYTVCLRQLEAAIVPVDLALGVLVGQTLTAADGSYSFIGLLPGVYYVTEGDREGWYMTVGPEGVFEVSNGTALEDLNFGNTQDLDLALTKEADVTTVTVGWHHQLHHHLRERQRCGGRELHYRRRLRRDPGRRDRHGWWGRRRRRHHLDAPRSAGRSRRPSADYLHRRGSGCGVAAGTLIENVAVIDHPRDENPENDSDDEVVEVVDPFLPFTPEQPETPADPVDPVQPQQTQICRGALPALHRYRSGIARDPRGDRRTRRYRH